MKWKLLSVVLIAAMMTLLSLSAGLDGLAGSSGWKQTQAQGTQEDASSERARENAWKVGVLERSFRFRPRLNTHLLMLKFRR